MIQIELPEALHPVFDGIARYRVAYGGRGSAKSHSFARMALLKAYEKPRRILCARELQNSIKDSVHRLLCYQIEQMGLTGFDVGSSYIRHANGSEFIFKGIRSNSSEIKSMEGIDIAWVEEAQGVSQESWDVLVPTIRARGSEIWVTFNPNLKSDPTSQKFIENPPPNCRVVKVNYDQNPWFSGELKAEMEYLKAIDVPTYKHVWEGEYKDPNKGGRVVPGWALANIQEIPYQPNQRIYLTCDFNVDPMAWALCHIFTLAGERHYHFFDEICIENTNIITAVEDFAKRYGKHKAGIIITGDSSGGSRTDGTPEPNQTRYKLMLKTLSDMGVTNFSLDAPRANPHVETRIEVWNNLICNHRGERRIKFDPRCKQGIRNNEGLHYNPGDGKVWQPTPKQIEKDNKMKFDRQDMFDAVSYLVNRYDPRIEDFKGNKGPNMKFINFEPVR